MSLIDDVLDFIASDSTIESAFGESITAATNLFFSFEPDTPSNCITIYSYGGSSPERGSKRKYNAAIQVRVRNSNSQTGFLACQAVIDQMHENGNVITNSNGMLYAVQSQPQFLYRDESGRSVYVSNFRTRHVRY